MTSSTILPIGEATVTCSKSRLQAVTIKRNTAGYDSLNEAELAVWYAAGAGVLRVIDDGFRFRGAPAGQFFQIPGDVLAQIPPGDIDPRFPDAGEIR